MEYNSLICCYHFNDYNENEENIHKLILNRYQITEDNNILLNELEKIHLSKDDFLAENLIELDDENSYDYIYICTNHKINHIINQLEAENFKNNIYKTYNKSYNKTENLKNIIMLITNKTYLDYIEFDLKTNNDIKDLYLNELKTNIFTIIGSFKIGDDKYNDDTSNLSVKFDLEKYNLNIINQIIENATNKELIEKLKKQLMFYINPDIINVDNVYNMIEENDKDD